MNSYFNIEHLSSIRIPYFQRLFQPQVPYEGVSYKKTCIHKNGEYRNDDRQVQEMHDVACSVRDQKKKDERERISGTTWI